MQSNPQEPSNVASDTPPRRLAAIVCMDMAGYSALAERDEPGAAAAVDALRRRAEDLARRHDGRIFSTAGDAFLLEFASANNAVAAALTLIDQAEPGAQPVRVGVHLGDVMETAGGDLLGHTVNIAARLQNEAGRNCVIASRAVFDLVRGANAQRFKPIGFVDIDKTTDSVEAFAFDPGQRAGAALGRRRRRWKIAGVAAVTVAAAALLVSLWSATMAGANRADMLARLSADLTRQIAANGALSQESIDGAFLAVSDLSRSAASPEQQAFALLRDGQTAGAVAALESFAADLQRQELGANAAIAWSRAGALAQFADRERALANFQRAYELAPTSHERFAELIQGLAIARGYDEALRFARSAIDDPASSPHLAAYAGLYASILAGDLGDTPRQEALLTAAEQTLASLGDGHLNAYDKIARGYLAFQRLDLRNARALYEEGRAAMATIPGHERDHQQGWLLVLSAMGDFEAAWRDGRTFVTERSQSGAPPWAQMMVTTCIAGLQAERPERVAPYCQAGARGLSGSVGEPMGSIGLAMLATEQDDLVAARAHLEGARGSPWYDAIPATAAYAGWTEARIAAKAGDLDAMHAAIDRTLRRIQSTPALAPRAAMFTAFLERRRGAEDAIAGRLDEGCAALARSLAAYREIGAEPGANAVERARSELVCPALTG